MKSQKIAVDIVLIPPQEIVDLAVRLAKNSPKTANEDYALDGKTCMPHITLVQGLARVEKLQGIEDKLSKIGKKFSPLALSITRISVDTHPDGKIFSSFEVGKTPELLTLHLSIFGVVASDLSWRDASTEMFYPNPPVTAITPYWVKGFVRLSSRKKYWPHISLGFVKPKNKMEQISFTASKLALYQLGNYCTCRKYLWSAKLKK